MKILLAQPRGVCAGVDRAVKIVEIALERFGPPLYVRREIVHNRHTVQRLRARGVVFVDELDEVPDEALVVFSAHGVSPAVKSEASRRGLRAIDATCPLVAKVHQEVLRNVERDRSLVLIGHAGHDEVVGTVGHAPQAITLVTSVEDARTVALPRQRPLVALTQTTLSLDDTAEILAELRRRFPRLEQPAADDICSATQNRQNAGKAMAERVDLLRVVGSANSSNAARLVEVGQARGVAGHLIDDETEIDPLWLQGVETVGLTSGASTPEALVQRVIDRLRELGAHSMEACETVDNCPSAWRCIRMMDADKYGTCSDGSPGAACRLDEDCVSNNCDGVWRFCH